MNNEEYSQLLADISERFSKQLNGDLLGGNDEPNIFEILQIQNKEVLFCRFLNYVLDPNSKFNNGDTNAIERFIKQVLQQETEGLINYQTALEERVAETRRIDIEITAESKNGSGNYVFPIEVKIYAGDQKAQLYDYYHNYYDNNKYKEPKLVYYLTPTGKEPSDESKRSKDGKIALSKSDYKCIDYFSDDFINWLNDVKEEYSANVTKYLLDEFIKEINTLKKDITMRNNLFNALDCTDNDMQKVDELIIAVLNNSDTVKRRILQRNIKRRITGIPEGYKIREIDEVAKVKDKWCILAIDNSDETPVAWIAVETNLYIIAENLKPGVDSKPSKSGKTEWEKSNEAYYWHYLHLDSRNRCYSVGKYLDKCLDDSEINIEQLFNDIDVNASTSADAK